MKEIHVGCSGFYNTDWKGEFYPVNLSSKNYLEYYSKIFNAVEINSSFYRKPTMKTLQNWNDTTPDEFRFFIKIPKKITHDERMKNVTDPIKEFCTHIASGLKNKLSGFLFQLPPSFIFSNENTQRIITALDDTYLNVIEFRHASWWNKEVQHILTEKNIVFSGVSIPKNISDEVIMSHPDILYYRLHGTPVMFRSAYSEEFLNALAIQIKNAEKTAYVFFNNTWGLSAIRNAKYFQEQITS